MTEPAPHAAASRTASSRPSLHGTVLNVAAVAIVAAALVWSALFVELLRKRSDAAAPPPAAQTGQLARPDLGQPAQLPAPVTTRPS